MDSIQKFSKDVDYKIDKHSERLDIPEHIGEMAKRLFGMFNSQKVAYSRPDDVFALSSLYLAHKVLGEPTSPSELVGNTSVNENHVIRAYKRMQSQLSKEHGIKIEGTTPDQHIEKYAKKLGISEKTTQLAKDILEKTSDLMQNKADNTKAASSLYLACKMNDEMVPQHKIAEVAGVTEVTIRNRYSEQEEQLAAT